MLRGSEPPTPERARDSTAGPADAGLASADAAAAAADAASVADLVATMPIAGLTRGRLLLIAGVIAAVWIVFAFWRQVGAAGQLTDRADALRTANAELESRVAQLQAELELVQTPAYVALQARGYRLGESSEVPFTLEPNAPPLAADAPGSASTAVGAEPDDERPIEAWLTLLFAPAD
ncbi:MAG: hypothetical protein L0221_02990 [Chloroflexi bacterium]|nr:hypothetical protein [Chloroflexota bacterium]